MAVSPTLLLSDLGSDRDIAFYGQVGVATLTVPVPQGMVPASLNVTAQLPVNVRTATVTVSQDDRTIARVDIPPGEPVPVVIPLAGVRVVDNAVTVLLRSYLMPLDGYCLDPTNPLRLTDVTLSFVGNEVPPSTVADFLPPVLRKLVLYVSRTPSHAESDAVVHLATAIVAYYGKQYPQIEVVPLADPGSVPVGAAQPFERHIVVAEGADTGVSLYSDGGPMPALLIAGPSTELTNQTRLLTSSIARYALSTKAVVGPLDSAPQLPGNDTTIRLLGQPGVNATALNPLVVVGLDQTRIGRAVDKVRVHLMGSYTPLPQSVGGQVVASIGDETIDRWPADPSGVIDKWVDVPDNLLRRYTGLAVQVGISGNTGRCGEFQPITLTIDGETVVQSKPAIPPIPQGFQSMPQALMPRVQIGLVDGAFADTVRAVQIMTGLQRLSALPIDTEVMPIQEAIDSANPAVLISPAGWNYPAVTLPVSAPDAVPMTLNVFDDTGAATTLTLDPAVRFGSLQAVFDGRRSLLIATSNGAVDQLDDLLRWLGEDVRRWSAIDGVAVVAVAGREPVTVTAPNVVSRADPDSGQPSDNELWWWVGSFALGIAAIFAVLVLRARRRPAG